MRVVHEACVGFGVACQLREGELSAYLVDEFAYDIVRERSKDGIVIDMSACKYSNRNAKETQSQIAQQAHIR